MKDLKYLKDQINKNNDIKKVLEKCDDNFLLKNQSIILAALDKTIHKGYKIQLKIIDDSIDWSYVPFNNEAKLVEKKRFISSNYLVKLPSSWNDYYLLDLNDVKWTEDRRKFADECKLLIKKIDKNEIPKNGFWLWGPNDSGKTFLTISLLNSIAKKNKKVAFVNILELSTYFKKVMYEDNSYHIFEKVKDADYVVIDDLGAERTSIWFKENILLPLIDYRANANKMIIFNSNFKISGYEKKIINSSTDINLETKINEKIIFRIKKLTNNKEIKIG